MGQIKTILHCQGRAYWRRVTRPGSLTVGNQGILLIVSMLFFMKYVRALSFAGNEIAKGNPGSLERLLFAITLAWLFPLLSSTRSTVAIRTVRHLPLSLTDLFFIKAGSLFLPPFSWMVVAGSLAIGAFLFIDFVACWIDLVSNVERSAPTAGTFWDLGARVCCGWFLRGKG